jgi:hypothetical protein
VFLPGIALVLTDRRPHPGGIRPVSPAQEVFKRHTIDELWRVKPRHLGQPGGRDRPAPEGEVHVPVRSSAQGPQAGVTRKRLAPKRRWCGPDPRAPREW